MNSEKKKRIVILLGAGFPLTWDAPTSKDIKNRILDIIRSKPYGNEIIEIIQGDDSSNSFEYILAAIESAINFKLHENSSKDFNDKIYRLAIDVDIEQLWAIYSECINAIIELIDKYESNWNNSHFNESNNLLKGFFTFLKENYHHINCYSLNYDEVLPDILNLPPSCRSFINLISENRFIYDYYKLRRKQITYINLHGSIHLYQKVGVPHYEIRHSYATKILSHALLNIGGNPNEPLIFAPIITGHNKTQRILSEHFSFPFTAFVNDLSDCDTFMTIGYSFGDPHINSQIYQYTKERKVNYAFITKENGSIAGSSFENSFKEAILIPQEPYHSDADVDKIYHWSCPPMNTYKMGFKEFLKDEKDWNICI